MSAAQPFSGRALAAAGGTWVTANCVRRTLVLIAGRFQRPDCCRSSDGPWPLPEAHRYQAIASEGRLSLKAGVFNVRCTSQIHRPTAQTLRRHRPTLLKQVQIHLPACPGGCLSPVRMRRSGLRRGVAPFTGGKPIAGSARAGPRRYLCGGHETHRPGTRSSRAYKLHMRRRSPAISRTRPVLSGIFVRRTTGRRPYSEEIHFVVNTWHSTQ